MNYQTEEQPNQQNTESQQEQSEETKELLFEVNEKVLCYHGPLIYEAKIMDRQWMNEDPELQGPYYFVHYKGWKRTWDEWVPETRLLKWCDENIKMQLRLRDLYRMKQSGRSQNTYKEAESSDGGLGKRRRDAKLEKEEDYLRKPEIKLEIPDALKGQLVDDWENVTKNQQLVTLPREITVNGVLERYKAYKREKKGNRELNEDLLEEVLHGLRIYFNKALGTMLLYRFERHQYAEILRQHPNTEPVDVYGAEHLLRLFVQMPSLIAHTTMDTDAVQVLTDYLSDILRFMQKQQKQLFQTEYENAVPGYVALSEST
ncbi:MRG-domain-containing protein [Rhizopus microsporus ATCC 52813]|uniref:Chromatin modification-related protein EAF3 n=1 Tax=Rhizopus microsporus ATCC 52813 TaxID=1340429 RepID=A0A2G4SPT8_RHIZD|nr:MRG-domain-containing protein [Rhizopus microsporus ATCC 52813]PHZ10794.1 MRG-domain-containing protein [Rhizopus microsporus ATCC 52813]